MDDKVFEQAVNVARLPGIVQASYVMPDAHWGYGFPIGGVAATRYPDGVISPGAIGYDINCGVRLLSSQLLYEEAKGKLDRLSFALDGATLASSVTCTWAQGSNHTIGTTSLQSGGSGIQYLYNGWSDGGGLSHAITVPASSTAYTANFRTQYYLTMTHGTGGTVSPSSGWKNSGSTVSISATPTNNNQVSYSFAGWTGSGSMPRSWNWYRPPESTALAARLARRRVNSNG